MPALIFRGRSEEYLNNSMSSRPTANNARSFTSRGSPSTLSVSPLASTLRKRAPSKAYMPDALLRKKRRRRDADNKACGVAAAEPSIGGQRRKDWESASGTG